MTDPFHSSKYSVEHAKRRVKEFEGEEALFFKSDPYAHVIEFDANTAQDVHKIKLTKAMPVNLPGIAFDALNGLRSALDQTGYACATVAGRSGKKAHFPFGNSPEEVQSRMAPKRGGSSQLPKEIFDLMASFEPYDGGNNLLWALNKLCNTQKHELIMPSALYVGGGTTQKVWFESAEFVFPPTWDAVKNEMVLARVSPGAAYDIDFDLAMLIAIGDIKHVRGKPAIAILNELVGITERIVAGVEAEARRIGLIT